MTSYHALDLTVFGRRYGGLDGPGAAHDDGAVARLTWTSSAALKLTVDCPEPNPVECWQRYVVLVQISIIAWTRSVSSRIRVFGLVPVSGASPMKRWLPGHVVLGTGAWRCRMPSTPEGAATPSRGTTVRSQSTAHEVLAGSSTG